jgi:hypothetical protein
VLSSRSVHCESILGVAKIREQFRNPEEGERKPLEPGTKRLVKDTVGRGDPVRALVSV